MDSDKIIFKKQKLKRLLAKFYFPLDKLLKSGPRFSVLMYHSINPNYPWSVSPQNFEDQIKYLSSNYHIASLSDLRGFADDSIAITFDDGYEDNFYYAFPILKKYNCPATFFICSDFIDKGKMLPEDSPYNGLKPLSPGQINTMRKAGMDFGGHTVTHPNLAKIKIAEARDEIFSSKIFLENVLGEKINLFAYPFGQLSDYNQGIIGILKEAGYQLACSTVWGRNNKQTPLFEIRRIRIDHIDSMGDFKGKIRGKWDFITWYHKFKKNG
ncbi:MAG: polysaccharide deacetylase family protein [Candidatus Paceibacterota bacterium]|jgi:peptidoglycan/xylan/chitin deacetylase (PgdA/CDA1 family)